MESIENKRILLVDDDPDIHEAIKSVLIDAMAETDQDLAELEKAALEKKDEQLPNSPPPPVHYTIDSAFQGEEGLKMVIKALDANQPYALIFMDMRMPPGWDGMRTIQEVWKVAPKTEVVIVSAYSDYSTEDYRNTFGETERLFILNKPFHSIELQQIAHALVKKWSLSNQLERHMANLEEGVQAAQSSTDGSNAGNDMSGGSSDDNQDGGQLTPNALQMMKEKMKSSRLWSFIEKNEAIKHNVENIADYVSKKSNEVPLVNLMFKVGNALKVEKATLIEKIHSIEQEIENVRGLVSMQQEGVGNGFSTETVKMSELLEEVLQLQAVIMERNGVKIVKSFEDLPEVKVQKNMLVNVFVNLISNAKDAMLDIPPEKRIIKIRTTKDEEFVKIQVADSGHGISQENLKKLFNHGFTTKKGGHGFGLRISAKAMMKMGGKISVESEGEGKGAVFTVSIPIRSD